MLSLEGCRMVGSLNGASGAKTPTFKSPTTEVPKPRADT
jgi:hypothetical protein